MRTFEDIYAIAAERHGGAEGLETQILAYTGPMDDLGSSDDRWLAAFSRVIFQAGISWKVIDNKWPGFEEAFFGFDLDRCANLHDEDFDRLVSDTRIVRHGPKIKSVQENAVFLCNARDEAGSVREWFSKWPHDEYHMLLAHLKKHASRLGGTGGQYALRYMGYDGYILGKDVVGRLVAEGVIDKAPTSQKAMQAVQEAFNILVKQSGRTQKEVSRVLALSIG